MFTRRTILHLLGVATAATAVPPLGAADTPPAAAVPPPSPDFEPALLQARITKLEIFLRSRGVKPAHLARDSGYARGHLLRIRMGRLAAAGDCAVAVTCALRRLAGEAVVLADVFDRDIVLAAFAQRRRILREAHPFEREYIRAAFGRAPRSPERLAESAR